MRRTGILLPLSSLPSPYGIGSMGAAAREFVDFLDQAGQSCWQLLPLGPTSFGDSPYQAFSSYAGNPYFIDLDDLALEGLLRPEEYQDLPWGEDPARVDYGILYQNRFPVLRAAVRRLLRQDWDGLTAFCRQQKDWLADYALFMALKYRHGGTSWDQWPREERLRQPQAMARARESLRGEIAFWEGFQYLFFRQWDRLKGYANRRGISIIGDLPIYVANDSVDVWASPEQFQLDEDGRPTHVSGCPPDAFAPDGQLWGNHLFDWEGMKQDGYRWWIRRIAHQFTLYDTLRIDHFRGFDEYYAVPAGDTTARNGHWRPGPGIAFFRAVEDALGPRDIIAEDLGFLTDTVLQLLEDSGYPGMKVLQFAFGSRDEGGPYLPHTYPKNAVVYTGTHDNEPIAGWVENASPGELEFARDYLRINKEEGWCRGMMRSAWASPADLSVIQFQDLLGLGNEARMNTPSTTGANWQWRTLPGTFPASLARELRAEARTFQRLSPRGRERLVREAEAAAAAARAAAEAAAKAEAAAAEVEEIPEAEG